MADTNSQSRGGRTFTQSQEEHKASDPVSQAGKSELYDPNKLDELVPIIRKSITFKTTKVSMFSKVENTFTGQDLKKWFQAKFNNDNESHLVKVCQNFLDQSIIHPVNSNNSSEFDASEKTSYRFQMDKPGIATNMTKIWSKEVRMPLAITHDLILRLNEVLTEMRSSKTQWDQQHLIACPSYLKFIDMSAELQRVNLATSGRSDKLAFFLNIYQILNVHHLLKVKLIDPASAPKSSGGVFSKISGFVYGSSPDFFYNIAGHNFTVDDVKHGILRSNKKSPDGHFRGWSGSDPRIQLLQVKDPRVLVLYKEDGDLPDKLEMFTSQEVDEVASVHSVMIIPL
jgi:NIMA (never in mitosis gene a)-related kinase